MSDAVAAPSLRRATKDDCRALWEWRNEPATRAASFSTEPIAYDRHCEWFAHALDDDALVIFVIGSGEADLGYVRFELRGAEAEISVSLAPGARRRGYGSAAISMAADRLLRERSVSKVVAKVKRENAASLGAFERAGFVVVDDGVGPFLLAYPAP